MQCLPQNEKQRGKSLSLKISSSNEKLNSEIECIQMKRAYLQGHTCEKNELTFQFDALVQRVIDGKMERKLFSPSFQVYNLTGSTSVTLFVAI